MTETATPAEAPTDDTVTLAVDRFGQVDRRELLGAFADGKYVTPIYGPDRPLVAASIASHLRGIAPTREDLLVNAFAGTEWTQRKINAYRNGRAYLASAYYGYASSHELPEV